MSTVKITIHPGIILKEEFMAPLGITQADLADRIGVSRRRINEIVKGRRAITADTAKRLSKAFGNSALHWMNMQNLFDLNSLTEPKGIRKIRRKAKSEDVVES